MRLDQLHRDLGLIEGNLKHVEGRLDKIDTTLERIDDRLARIEERENQRKGAWAVIAVVASGFSAVVAWAVSALSN